MSSFKINHFNWLVRQPTWRLMQAHRANMAKFNSIFADASTAANSTMFGALSDQASGNATLAARAGLTRVQKAGKALVDANSKRIDDAQALLDRTKVNTTAATGTSASSSTNSVLNTLA
jgi:hypothetical protein